MNYQPSYFNHLNQLKECNPNDWTSCPAGHFCGYNFGATARICVRNPIEDGTQDCNLRGNTGDCPLGYECLSKSRAGNKKTAPDEALGKCYRRPRGTACMKDNMGNVVACP